MRQQTFITKGQAVLTASGLRCNGPRKDKDSGEFRPCNKLIAKRNGAGQIAGSFRCERCKQDLEIEIGPIKVGSSK